MRTYQTVVFRAAEGGGNPCPVTLDADALTTEQMQAMTKEFGFESVFLMQPDREDCDIKARYFVPLHEMEMCVHATIGSATVLVEKGRFVESPIYYETAFGKIQVDWSRDENGLRVSAHQFLPRFAEHNPTAEEVCAALRITPEQLAPQPVCSAATSRMKLIVPLRSRETLDALEPDFEALWALCDKYDTTGFYPYAQTTGEDGRPVFWARQFPKRAGYPEDPATGVAASALGAYLVENRLVPLHEGWNRMTVMQGFAMHRPSRIDSEVQLENGRVVGTRVSGSAELV